MHLQTSMLRAQHVQHLARPPVFKILQRLSTEKKSKLRIRSLLFEKPKIQK